MNLDDIRNGKVKNLYRVNLIGANLHGADLRWANLHGANLHGAKLSEADLRWANLHGANLHGAKLSEADLSEADLRWADLHGADLHGAELPSPSMVLLATWGNVSDSLTTELMRLDAMHGPGAEAFTAWANGGQCPYDGYQFQRVANFNEARELWLPGQALDMATLARMLIKECCKND